MRPNRSMPDAIVIPVLAYPDVTEAVDWLCRAFGFRVRLRIATHRCQLMVGAGAAVVASQGGEASGDSGTHSVMVRVDAIDAHCERARAHGARIVGPPTDYPYGERQYSAVDPGGHVWTFSESIADVDPAAWGGQLEQTA